MESNVSIFGRKFIVHTNPYYFYLFVSNNQINASVQEKANPGNTSSTLYTKYRPYVLYCYGTLKLLMMYLQGFSTFQDTLFGCCTDGQTPAGGLNGEGCPIVFGCEATAFGCCEDGVTPANGFNGEGCKEKQPHCEKTKYGCCPDGVKPAKGKKLNLLFKWRDHILYHDLVGMVL